MYEQLARCVILSNIAYKLSIYEIMSNVYLYNVLGKKGRYTVKN